MSNEHYRCTSLTSYSQLKLVIDVAKRRNLFVENDLESIRGPVYVYLDIYNNNGVLRHRCDPATDASLQKLVTLQELLAIISNLPSPNSNSVLFHCYNNTRQTYRFIYYTDGAWTDYDFEHEDLVRMYNMLVGILPTFKTRLTGKYYFKCHHVIVARAMMNIATGYGFQNKFPNFKVADQTLLEKTQICSASSNSSIWIFAFDLPSRYCHYDYVRPEELSAGYEELNVEEVIAALTQTIPDFKGEPVVIVPFESIAIGCCHLSAAEAIDLFSQAMKANS